MEAAFWLDRWKENRIGFHRGDVNPRLLAYWSALNVRPPAQVFVPLCGKSRDMRWLAAQGHTVLGVELSPIAVDDFYRENNLLATRETTNHFERTTAGNISILRGDFFALTPFDLSQVAGVYDRAALIALPEPQRARYARHLTQYLPPQAPILLVTMEYRQSEMEAPPFNVSEEEVHALFGAAYRIERLLNDDALAAEPQLRERGLSQLQEKVFALRPKND